MLSYLTERVDTAIEDDFDLLRGAGEMSWVLPGPPGRDELFHYESALNHLVEGEPAVLLCLYDLQKFGAAMLVEVLRTHPKVLLDRTVIDNPHYVPPDDYRADDAGSTHRHSKHEPAAVGDEGTKRRWASLTEAELRVTSCVARGMKNRAIAAELIVSPHTVDAHLKHVFAKLEIHSRVELAVLAMQRGLALA